MTLDSSLVAALAPQLPALSWGSTEGPKITQVLPDGTACPRPFTSTDSLCIVRGQGVLSVAPRPLGDTGDPQPCRGSENRAAKTASAPWMWLLRGTERSRQVSPCLPAAAHPCSGLRFVAARLSPSPQFCAFTALFLPMEKLGGVRGAPTGAQQRGATRPCAGGT